MILQQRGLVGVAAWQCGNCGRVETANVHQVSFWHTPTPRCHCQSGVIWLMSPLNQWAQHLDESEAREMRMAQLKYKASQCMQEVNW